MARTKGKKDFTVKQREKMRYVIASQLKFRKTNSELLESLKDSGFQISENTLIKLKKN